MNLKFVQITIALLLAGYVSLVRHTTRWKIDGLENFEAVKNSGEGFIACTWHSRFLLTTAARPKMKQRVHFLISKSRDGNLVTYTARFLRAKVIRGSRRVKLHDKDKRGAGALRDMVQVLKNNNCVLMTPDGPRGPRMRVGGGPIRLAKLSGAPIFVYALSTSRRVIFKTWDRFMLPLPFARGRVIVIGPIRVSKDADNAEIERHRLKLENLLNTASQRCDKEVGNDPILPAPVRPAKS